MNEPWDLPPLARRGCSERTLYHAIGRSLMAWEEIEGTFAHIYSVFECGNAFSLNENKAYGKPSNYSQRVLLLQNAAESFFKKHPSQELEGEFAEIIRLANGFSFRRNDIAHGRARFSHWVLNPSSMETLLNLAPNVHWCVIPAHFKGNKFTEDNQPAYIFTAREIDAFMKMFWSIAHRGNAFMRSVEALLIASQRRPPLGCA